MRPMTLAKGLDFMSTRPKIHELEAKVLLQKHRETYRKFWTWAENNKDRGLLGLKLETCFGWSIKVTSGDVEANTFLN